MRALPEPDPKAGFKAQEKRAAQAVGGKLTAGSGNSKRVSHKGDAVGDLVRAEAKTTEHKFKSISIKRAWLDKIRREARETDKVAGFVFGWDAPTGPGAAVCVQREDWLAFPIIAGQMLLAMRQALLVGDFEQARALALRVKDYGS